MAHEAFCRKAGNGPTVVCLHANASSSSQWQALMERLAPDYRVIAPDAYGAGKSPDWPSDRQISLGDEVELIEPLLARADAPLALVGHSYGAAVALLAALRQPERIAALVLYEPTLFALLDARQPPPNAADGIRAAVAASAAALDAGEPETAAEHFIDYWMEPGSWRQMSERRQAPIAASVRNVRRWAHALFGEPTPLAAFATLRMPVLYLLGERSTAAAHGVAELLLASLPQVERLEFAGLGHMGPVTHPQPVNEAIAGFLALHHSVR